MGVIYADKIKGTKIQSPYDRIIKVLLTPETQDEVKDLSMTMGIVYPNCSNDLHTHKGFEILYIVTGYGKAVIGEKTYEVRPDTIIVAPPGIVHQQINESDETMKMFCVWTPAVTGDEVVGRAIEAAK